MDNNRNAWGKAVIDKALEYANYEWCATEKNVMHGVDEAGRFVDTPDVTWRGEVLNCGWWRVNERNVGICRRKLQQGIFLNMRQWWKTWMKFDREMYSPK